MRRLAGQDLYLYVPLNIFGQMKELCEKVKFAQNVSVETLYFYKEKGVLAPTL